MFCTAFALTLGLSVSSQCPTDPWEVAYQSLHVVDFAQTVTGARSHECISEDDGITRNIIGRKPSVGRVEAYWAATAMLHYTVSGWLDRMVDSTDERGWRAARWVWRVVPLAETAHAVLSNAELGVKPFGGNMCSQPGIKRIHNK